MATAITDEIILTALDKVMDPELNRSVVALGFIQEIEIADDYVHLDIQLTTPMCPFADKIVESIRQATLGINGVNECEVERICMKNA